MKKLTEEEYEKILVTQNSTLLFLSAKVDFWCSEAYILAAGGRFRATGAAELEKEGKRQQ